MNRLEQIKSYFNKERLILIGVVVVLYFNALRNGYALDDSIVTEPNNITAEGFKSIPKILKSFYISSSEDYQFEYRPLVKISFAIEHEMFKVNPKTSHFFNIVLYVICIFLLLSVLQLLFEGYNKLIPFYAVLFFALMPIHSEVVTSIKNRDILLCFIFSMLGFKSYYRFYASEFKKWSSLLLAGFYLYLAFLSKYDVLPYIAIIPVLFYAKDTSKLKWMLIGIACLWVSLLLFKATKSSLLDAAETKRMYFYFENPLPYFRTVIARSKALITSLGFYLVQLVYPVKQSCYYGYDTIDILHVGPYAYLGLASIPVLIFGLVKSFVKKNFIVFAGLFMFCASISMYLNFMKPVVGIVADRFTFFASAGFAIVIVGLLFEGLKIKTDVPKNYKIAAVVVFVLFAFNVISRNKEWKDMTSVLNADVEKYPNSAFLNYKKAITMVRSIEPQIQQTPIAQRKFALAEPVARLETSIEKDGNYPNSRNYLAYVQIFLLNDFKGALPHVNKSLSLKKSTEIMYYKAIIMRETNVKDSAYYYLKSCIKMDSTFYNAYSLLMFDYNATKDYQKSLDMFNEAIQKGVKTESIYLGMARTYEAMNNKEEAKRCYLIASELNPNNLEIKSYIQKLK